jgi:hypothetical protein
MARTTFLQVVILGLGALGCAGSFEDTNGEATENVNALGAALDAVYRHVDLPGTCREFETLSFGADGAYRATLAGGARELGFYSFEASELSLASDAGGLRRYGLEVDDFAILLTNGDCGEVLELTEEKPCTGQTCGPTLPPTSPDLDPACAERTGGALVTFEVHGETLRVWSTNHDFVARAKELIGNADFHPTPLFERVIGGYDACTGREWSVDAERMSFADFTTEVCDAVPSYIDANLADWLTAPGSYCPWGPRVVAVEER